MLLALSLGLVPQPGGLVLRKMCPAASRAAVPVAQAEDKGWDGEYREMPVETATPLTDARRKAAQEQETTGCVPGGWDNDDYLEATKTGHQPPSNADALKQAIAYRDWLASQGHRPRQDVLDLIAELEAGMDPDELAGTGSGNSGEDYLNSVGAGGTGQTENEAERRRREDQAMRDNFVKQQQQAFYSAPKTSAPKVEASGQGVVSANSYSAMMGGAAAAPAAPAPVAAAAAAAAALPPPPPPPVRWRRCRRRAAAACDCTSMMAAVPPRRRRSPRRRRRAAGRRAAARAGRRAAAGGGEV